VNHVVLAYTGSVTTSAALVWLRQQTGVTVATLTLDVGQGSDLEEVRARAVALGAARAHVVDVRDEFARDCILPALRSGVFHDARAPIGHIAYPLIACKLVEIAAIEQASGVAHGGGESDHASLEAAVRALNPGLDVIPAIAASGFDRDRLMQFAREHGISIGAFRVRRTSSVRHLDVPAHVDVQFEDGVPVSVNGVPMPLTELIESVATIAGNHGIGDEGSWETTVPYEAPAAVVLTDAYEALVADVDGRVSGTVRVRLFKGEHTVVAPTPIPA
jgi:argininosuccinate synthase